MVGTGSFVGRGAPPDACDRRNGSHSPMCPPVAVTVGSGRSIERVLFVPQNMTRNGSMSKPLIFFIPAAILLRVFSASGFLRAKMFSPFSAQSMISRAGRHGLTFEPGNIEACDEAVFCRLWDGNGQVGAPLRVATINRRLRVVAS